MSDPQEVPWLPVLGYHRIVDTIPPNDYWNVCTTRSRFEAQMRWFARLGWRSLSLEDVAERLVRGERFPARHFTITFDDGYADNLMVAAPILKSFGFTATVFVVTGYVGQPSLWDEGQSWIGPLMTWDQLRVWREMGFSVGSHTVSHAHLGRLPRDAALAELVESRSTLEAELNAPIRTFCYPYGDWTRETAELVAAAGYDIACNNLGRLEHGRYFLARTNPEYWAPIFTPTIRCQEWYFTASRNGLLDYPRRYVGALRRRLTGRSQTSDYVPG